MKYLGWDHSPSNFNKYHAIVKEGTNNPYTLAKTACGVRISASGQMLSERKYTLCAKCVAKVEES